MVAHLRLLVPGELDRCEVSKEIGTEPMFFNRSIGALPTLAIWAGASAARVATLFLAPALLSPTILGPTILGPTILGGSSSRPIGQFPALFAVTFLVAVATSVVTETQSAHARALSMLRHQQRILA